MERRSFLRRVGMASVAGAGMGLLGGRYVRNVCARRALEEQLIQETGSRLTTKALTEIRELPLRGQEMLRTFFHAACLNADGFARVVTSEAFLKQNSERDSRDNELAFIAAFETHVVSAESVLSQIRSTTEELGDELDLGWQHLCEELSGKWAIHIRSYGGEMRQDLAAAVEPDLRARLQRALEESRGHAVAAHRRTLLDTVTRIGHSALLMLPLTEVPVAHPFVLPVFAVVVLTQFYEYYAGLSDRENSIERIRQAVSVRMANLGNWLGQSYAEQLRVSIARLHQWQQQTLNTAAAERAEAATGIL